MNAIPGPNQYSLPLTRNGKVGRAALPEGRQIPREAAEEPAGQAERNDAAR